MSPECETLRQAWQKAKADLCMLICIFRFLFQKRKKKKVTVIEGEKNDIFQVEVILPKALDNLFPLTWFRAVIWLIITSARICQRDGTNRAFLGNCNVFIGCAATRSELHNKRGF